MRYPAHRVLPPEKRACGLRRHPIGDLIMNEQHKIDGTVPAVRAEPGVPLIRNVNWAGMRALYMKEVRRFFKVQLQTIWAPARSEEHTSELQSLMRISYAVFCLKKKKK